MVRLYVFHFEWSILRTVILTLLTSNIIESLSACDLEFCEFEMNHVIFLL